MKTDPTITLSMIQVAIQIIDSAAVRGAFKGDELLTVGTLREQFSTFLQWQAAQPPAEAPVPSDTNEQAAS